MKELENSNRKTKLWASDTLFVLFIIVVVVISISILVLFFCYLFFNSFLPSSPKKALGKAPVSCWCSWYFRAAEWLCFRMGSGEVQD